MEYNDYDTDAARQALEAHFEPEQADSQTDVPVSTSEGEGIPAAEQAPDSQLFKDINPNSLTPELKSLYDSLRGDYTQKTQSLAEQRKEYDSLGDLETVKQAVEFQKALQDPNNLVQLHSELSDYLQANGLSKEQADAAATSGIQETQQEEYDGDYTDESNTLRKEIDEVRRFREQYEQERMQAEIESGLARQETAIRQSNPSYTDNDVHSIYQLAYAYGGDLMAAQKYYETERQRILSSYAETKASVPAGLSTPATSGNAEIPTKFASFEEAHDYAKRVAEASQAVGGY